MREIAVLMKMLVNAIRKAKLLDSVFALMEVMVIIARRARRFNVRVVLGYCPKLVKPMILQIKLAQLQIKPQTQLKNHIRQNRFKILKSNKPMKQLW